MEAPPCPAAATSLPCAGKPPNHTRRALGRLCEARCSKQVAIHRWSLTSFHRCCTPELGRGCIPPEQPLGAPAVGEQSPRGGPRSPGVRDPGRCCDDLSSAAGRVHHGVWSPARGGAALSLSLTVFALNRTFQQSVPSRGRVGRGEGSDVSSELSRRWGDGPGPTAGRCRASSAPQPRAGKRIPGSPDPHSQTFIHAGGLSAV